jgi:transposase
MTRRKFARSFKLEAVRLSEREDMTIPQAAADLGVPLKMLYRWRHELRERGEDAFRGNGRQTAGEERIAQLERQVAVLTTERDILKKAAAYFAQHQR